MTKFTCERNFNYANNELFTGVCNGKLPNIDKSNIIHTNNDIALENKHMFEDIIKPTFKKSINKINLDFEEKHRNKNKSFLFRNKAIQGTKKMIQKIIYLFYYN